MSTLSIQIDAKTLTNFLPARKNPFTVQLTTTLPFRFHVGNWNTQIQRLQHLDYRAAIVGPRGTGKSTCLRSLATKLDDVKVKSHLLLLPHDKNRHDRLVDEAVQNGAMGKILLVDGIERLRLRLKWKILRTKRIVATAHRRQFLPPYYLPTWFNTTTCKDLLKHLLNDLGVSDGVIQAKAYRLFESHRGNIREVLRELYDLKACDAI